MKTILAVLGTRPEAIKMAPVILELQKQPKLQTKVCFTGQHGEIAEEVLDTFHIVPQLTREWRMLPVPTAMGTPPPVSVAAFAAFLKPHPA